MLSQLILYCLSFILVAFGQPAWCWWCGLLAACLGYALFWFALSSVEGNKKRFWIATLWFGLAQAVQLSWLISHPYLYIWGVYFLITFVMGLQFGWLSLFVRPPYIEKIWKIVAIAGFWTCLEWTRLYMLSGFSWNPVGLAMSGSLYPLQLTTIAGVYGLSFWVMFVNLLALRAFFKGYTGWPWFFWLTAAAIPYIFGMIHVSYHDSQIQKDPQPKLSALLVQTAFPVEECLNCSPDELKSYVQGEWKQILRVLKEHQSKATDLIVLPEYVVPFGTWAPVFRWSEVRAMILDLYGEEALIQFPPLERPWGHVLQGEWFVTNAFFLQGISNLYNAELIAGAEDADYNKEGKIEHYNAALFFEPWNFEGIKRYEKRVLVPMGEYIPFEFCRQMALDYGIGGSFTPGIEAQVFQGRKARYGPSVCYEETYGDLMRENKRKGASVLVNLTSDVWYPNSLLPQQHRDHAKLRTTEGGLPLLRSCNTGVTCSIDSLGREVDTFGDDEWKQGALHTSISLYNYPTLYSHSGDSLIIGFSGFMTLLLFLRRNSKMS